MRNVRLSGCFTIQPYHSGNSSRACREQSFEGQPSRVAHLLQCGSLNVVGNVLGARRHYLLFVFGPRYAAANLNPAERLSVREISRFPEVRCDGPPRAEARQLSLAASPLSPVALAVSLLSFLYLQLDLYKADGPIRKCK
jgi:hypothetical protein